VEAGPQFGPFEVNLDRNSDRIVYDLSITMNPFVLRFEQSGVSPIIALGGGVGVALLFYGLCWVLISRFQEFSFNVRAMKRLYKAKVMQMGEKMLDKSFLSNEHDM
jgi:hypothetical protein